MKEYYSTGTLSASNGISLRDYFAGHALMGYLTMYGRKDVADIAGWAYAAADAMLAERGKIEPSADDHLGATKE